MKREEINNFNFMAMQELIAENNELAQALKKEGYRIPEKVERQHTRNADSYNGKYKKALLKVYRENVEPVKTLCVRLTQIALALNKVKERYEKAKEKSYMQNLAEELDNLHSLLDKAGIPRRTLESLNEPITGAYTLDKRIEMFLQRKTIEVTASKQDSKQKHLIKAVTTNDPSFPGIRVEIDGQMVALIEYNGVKDKLQMHLYTNGNNDEEPDTKEITL